LYEVNRVVGKILSCWSDTVSAVDLGSDTLPDEPLYETLVAAVKAEHPLIALKDGEQLTVSTIEGIYVIHFDMSTIVNSCCICTCRFTAGFQACRQERW
jgi:hypothetical protein